MKRIYLYFSMLLLCFNFSTLLAQEANEKKEVIKEEEKTYSVDEFKKAVEVEVTRKIDRIRSKNIAAFSRELLQKEEDIRLQEKRLKKREKQIVFNEKAFMKKVQVFEERQLKVLGCLSDNEKAASGRIDHLVRIISTMKPIKAAEVLSVQDSEISIKILSKLDSVKASKIFNSMDKEISARLQKQYMSMKK